MNRSFAALLVSISVAACGRSAHNGSVVASGHIEAIDVRVATKVRGRLLRRPVDEGDAVKAGQLLGILDTIDVELSLREAVAQRDQADAVFRLRVAGSRREDIAELAARVESVLADLAGAEKELKRQDALVAEGVTTAKTRDDALARRDALAGQLESAKQALARARAGSRDQEIEAARATRDAMEARIAQLRQQVVDATIGTGHVVMFAIRPYWRAQTQGTYFLGFNAIMNWNDLGAGK